MTLLELLVICCAATVWLRIVTYRRRGGRYRRGVSFVAWCIACACVALIVHLPRLCLPEPALALLALALGWFAVRLLRAGGNLAHLFDWRHS